ncbi:multidrug effflux MFS transporter [Chitinimonas lacunae]|uniref:Bcr/CflA family efflux transporter n=1 Tax=Chitinimonas lacunae TaxID=1963018 RepID=A0ABV8MPF6_9NEIS
MSSSAKSSSPAVLILLLAALSMFGPFSIDTVFPMFPEVEKALKVGPIEMQQTISVYLLSYGLMALLHGPLSDALGRRTVILGGVGLFVLASVGCALSESIWSLLFFRAIQGVSAGSGLIVGRAIIRDRFQGSEAQRVMSRTTMVFAIAPAIAPVIGGLIGTRFGWEAIFYFLALFSLLLGFACWRWLPETHPVEARLPLRPVPLFGRYMAMLRNPCFLWLSCSTSFNFAGQFLYISSAPDFVLKLMQLKPTQFAAFFVPMISGIMTGAWISSRMAGRGRPERIISWAYGLMLGSACANILYCSLAEQIVWPWAVIPMFVTGIGTAMASPSITIWGLDHYPNERGTAASLQSFMSLMLNAVVAGVLSPLLSHSALWLALGACSAMVLGWLSWRHAYAIGAHRPEAASESARG